jgi:decaprenyl-phosphate phosphoribosyltransferase
MGTRSLLSQFQKSRDLGFSPRGAIARATVAHYLRLMRVQQWIKNSFVLAPLFFSGSLTDPQKIGETLSAVVCFCLLSSAVYIFNDLCDVQADRQHAKKRYRPIASGAVPIPAAWALIGALLAAAGGLLLASGANHGLAAVLVAYLGINVAYSSGLKNVPLVELCLVASGFVLRLLAGGVAIGVELTSWILICTALVSLLMVVGKRRADLGQGNDPQFQRVVLRNYDCAYLDRLLIMIAGATLVAYLLFCTSPYGHDRYGEWVVLTGAFVALGIFRFLQIVTQEGGGDSPTSLVIKDRFMRWTLVAWIAAFGVIIYIR